MRWRRCSLGVTVYLFPMSDSPTAAQPIAALSIRGVHKRFGGVVAVNGCTFDVPQGSITGLIGPNGAGKTTLFNVISGFLAPNEGQILLNGVDVAGEKPNELFQRGLVRTFQIPHEFQRMTVLENLMVVPSGQQGERILNTWLRWSKVQDQAVIRGPEKVAGTGAHHDGQAQSSVAG